MKNVARLFTQPTTDEMEPFRLGMLFLSSGNVVACDPLTSPEMKPFAKTVQPGKYAVNLYSDPGEGGIAYAELKISDEHVVKWEMAVKEGQDITTLKEGEIFGYPVDTGLGSFMGADTAKLIDKHDRELQQKLGDKYVSYYDDYFEDLMDSEETGDNFIAQPYPELENNFAVFTSGYGDGFYATYVGLDKNDLPVKFITEFVSIEEG
jgi:hypothetical protein